MDLYWLLAPFEQNQIAGNIKKITKLKKFKFEIEVEVWKDPNSKA